MIIITVLITLIRITWRIYINILFMYTLIKLFCVLFDECMDTYSPSIVYTIFLGLKSIGNLQVFVPLHWSIL